MQLISIYNKNNYIDVNVNSFKRFNHNKRKIMASHRYWTVYIIWFLNCILISLLFKSVIASLYTQLNKILLYITNIKELKEFIKLNIILLRLYVGYTL